MNKRILIIDDVNFNIEFASKLIKNLMEGFDVDVEIEYADCVEDAVHKITSEAPYDVMIIDMNLPDGCGIDVAKAAREKDPDTRLAALTIYPNEYEKERPFFDLFMKKPIKVDTFKENFLKLIQV